MTPLETLLATLESNGLKPRKVGTGLMAKCPSHDDKTASLSIGTGEDGKVLLHCHAGCSNDRIVHALGMEMADLYPTTTTVQSMTELAVYPYRDELGVLLYEVVRYAPKTFRVRRPAEGGGWVWNLTGTRRVLYRLPELMASDHREIVFIPEGEKDVDNLTRLGVIATTNPGGAGKWKSEYNASLSGRRVVVLADNDKPGLDSAKAIASSLSEVCPGIRVLTLPDLSDKGDVSDWIARGGTREELVRMATGAEKPEHPTVFSDPSDLFTQAKSDPLPLGLSCLSNLRIEPGSLSVVAARPAVGKSAMLATFALAAARGGWRVLFLSLEMPTISLKRRFASMVSGVPLSEVIKPTGTSLVPHLERERDLPITIRDQSSLGGRKLPAVVEAIRSWKGERAVVMLDYLQRLQPENPNAKRYEEIGEWCRTLQSLAQTCNMPIVVAAQLGRGVEQRGKDSRPQLSDLRESGDIEAEADNVLLIWRDGRKTELAVRKQRMGEEFPARCYFDGPHCLFEDMDWS